MIHLESLIHKIKVRLYAFQIASDVKNYMTYYFTFLMFYWDLYIGAILTNYIDFSFSSFELPITFDMKYNQELMYKKYNFYKDVGLYGT